MESTQANMHNRDNKNSSEQPPKVSFADRFIKDLFMLEEQEKYRRQVIKITNRWKKERVYDKNYILPTKLLSPDEFKHDFFTAKAQNVWKAYQAIYDNMKAKAEQVEENPLAQRAWDEYEANWITWKRLGGKAPEAPLCVPPSDLIEVLEGVPISEQLRKSS